MSSKITSKAATASNSTFKTHWSKREKLRLLKALKIHGHTDINKVTNMVATKSQKDVEVMINKLMVQSQAIKSNTNPIINEWLECESIKKTIKKKSLIRQVLLFIYLFEKHPTSTDGKCDYRAIYHFIYKLFCGCEAPELSKENQKLLYEVLSEVIEQTVSKPQKDIIITLEKLLDKKAGMRTYPGKKKA
ncbi:hypothetical protein KPH14_006246 [Odynerus spinipes]|uniref:Uncharacterized protein n=1 Tax=Odynerus spinipes TaxID=1348599 RepID=A0AAD9RIW8_9HYME|nr:hypothetical protein KPH14_006246 [Odynerus spinipes]